MSELVGDLFDEDVIRLASSDSFVGLGGTELEEKHWANLNATSSMAERPLSRPASVVSKGAFP